MKALLMLISFVLSCSAFAGEWVRENEQTISFKGEILADEYERFSSVFDNKVNVLKVDSGGGETSAGMKIGEALRQNNVAIEVHHWCLSSCANYFFVGATKRTIIKGIVGYHGNVTACFTGKGWEKLLKQLTDQGVSAEQIAKIKANIDGQVKTEASFYKIIGVSQSLFDISCTNDKGVGDGKDYAFLLPTSETFEAFGIVNVIGIQDLETINEFPQPLAIW